MASWNLGRWALVALAASVCMGCRTIPDADILEVREGSSSEPLPTRFTALVWNLGKGRSEGWGSGERFRSLVAAESCALALVQEIPPGRDEEITADAAWTWSFSLSFGDSQGDNGVATGSPAPGTAQALRTESWEYWLQPKTAILTWHPFAGGADTLLVANVHCLRTGEAERIGAQLEPVLDAIAAHPGPVLLGGDFNTWDVARLELVQQLTTGLEVVSFADSGDDGRFREEGIARDWVFVRGLTVERAWVERDVPTEHRPLLVTCALPSAE